jgi:hypothetical protein
MQRPSPAGIVVDAAGRGLCLFFFCIAFVTATEPAMHAQSPRDDLPPLRTPRASSPAEQRQRPMGEFQFRLLVPPTPLLCWSHPPMENPQGGRDNAENGDAVTDATLRRGILLDPMLGPIAPPRRDP